MNLKWILLPTVLLLACEEETKTGDDGQTGDTAWRGAVSDTVAMGASDNAEVIKLLPDGKHALLASSKARKISLLALDGGALTVKRDRVLFPEDTGEGELTHVDFFPDGKHAALTRTIPVVDAAGMQTDCQGSLVVVRAEDTDRFGEVVVELPVGPMPDAVDVSPDGRWIVVANERDAVELYGKCAVTGPQPSISLIDASGFPTLDEVARVELDGDAGQEPEQVIFSADSDHVAVPIQDAQQVALFRASELAAKADPTAADLKIVTLPQNSLGADPWPDGVAAFQDEAGGHFYAIAGEYNDALYILDTAGTVVATSEIVASMLPAEFPRAGAEDPPFRPDSLTSFAFGERPHVAASLKHAGAVGVWDVSAPAAPVFVQAVKVGENETGTPTTESSVSPEGIAATKDGAAIVTANEGESSASLVLRE